MAAAGILSAAAPAWAQIDAEQANTMAEADQQVDDAFPPATLGAELGFGGIGEDYFLTLGLRLSIDRADWGLGVQVPLRFRVWDRDPQNDETGGLRKEDWDQVSDYFRVLRYVYFGQADKRGPYYVRIGELAGTTVGHGTIMHRYLNNVDVNRWRTGVNARVEHEAYSGEVVVGDLFDPYLFGLRGTWRPFDALLPEPERNPWASRLVIGHSLFVDGKAPIALARDADGRIETNDDGVPVVARERALLVLGLFDVGYELLRTEHFSITPYTDLNKMTQVPNGWGWHLGVLWHLQLPMVIDDLVADLRTEYRFVSGDYVGPYFNVVYEIERYQRLNRAGGTAQPKLLSRCAGDPLCDSPVASARHGYFFEARAGLPKWVFVGLEYLDYSGPRADGQFRLSVDVPALEFLQLSAYYYRINVDGPGDLFAIDDKSAIVAQATVPLYWVLALNLRWWRVWRSCGDDAAVCDESGFQSVDDWSISVGATFTF